MKTALLATVLAFCPALAHAQTVVIGQGAAQSCYQSAIMGDMGSRSAIRTCSEAFNRGMSNQDKTATYVNRGVLQMRRGDLDKAIADYEKALDRDPKLAEAHINHGVVLYLQGDDAEALEAYNIAITLGTNKMAEALYNRALVYDRMDNASGAYHDLKSVLELKPDWEDARVALDRYTVVTSKES